MEWTSAQRETIETRNKNILVSAAAGSGKTTVLIERIKQLVLQDHTDIDRFLITTFTNAAAAEMKEKMERAIHKEMDRLRGEQGAAEDLLFLQRQLDLLPQSSISTFHTFSLGIIRNFFFLTDLQPGFQIGDETQLSIMRTESVDEVFESRFEKDTQQFKKFLRSYSGDRNDNRLKQQVLDIYQKLRSIPRYMDWAGERLALMESEAPLKALGIDRFLLETVSVALSECIRWYEEAALRLNREETGSLYLKARQDAEKLMPLRDLAEQELQQEHGESVGNYLEALNALMEDIKAFKPNQMRAAAAEKDAFEAVKEEVQWLRRQGKDCLDKVKEKYFSLPLDEAGQALRNLAPDTGYFIGLIREVEQVYLAKKQARNVVDFDDCMHCCLDILQDENAAAEYREQFKYIFIDEYQDSNFLQEEIIGRIAREDNLFMVGDVKQSIYKFRLAEPEIFRGRYEEYRSGRDERSVRIDLNNNFRSRRRIRDAVNRIFEQIMEGYDEDARLNGPAGEEGSTGYPVRLHILADELPEEMENAAVNAADAPHEAADAPHEAADAPHEAAAESHGAAGEEADPLEETELIAHIIRDTLGKPITERDGTVRPITYGDIAVLSRGGAMIPQIERYLNNEGIPAFGETAGGYYETVEIQVFINLLQTISNLSQDVPLISAMSSVVFDFTPRELARIRIECREGSFSSAVRWYGTDGSIRRIREKVNGMLDQIALWKEIGRTVPLDELMRILLYETGYYDYCSGLPTGEQRISNLRLLLEKAAAYEQTSHMGLYGFLSYVEAMRRTGQKVSEASLMGEGRDVVHVMTVHKSKGLEFPVVILAGAGHKITGASEGRAPVMHKDFAIALPEVNADQHWERKTILQKAIAGKKTRENLEEEIRILYVALTRPMEQLDIVASMKNAAKLQHFPGKGSFLDLIYSTMDEMASEDPDAARVLLYDAYQPLPKAGRSHSETSASESTDAASAPAETAARSQAHGPQQTEAEQGTVPRFTPQAGGVDVEQGTVPRFTSQNGDVDELRAEIDRRLSWRYPYETPRVRTKYSVTQLAHQQAGEGPQIPDLLVPGQAFEEQAQAEVLSAPQIGTAMHTVMERIDFAAALDEGIPYIRRMTDALHEEGFLTDAEHTAIDVKNIDAFFRSDIGARAARADMLMREKEFLLQQEIDGVDSIVQGIIDLYFEDEEGLILVDYKNSWAANEEDEARLIQRYGPQIRLYRQALESALGRPVDEAWLYLFRSRRFVKIEEGDNGDTDDRG